MEINYSSLLCDFYELTMAQGYLKNRLYKNTAYFDVFFRKIPDNGGFAIFAGLEQIISFVKNLKFSKSDIEFLRENTDFDEEFLSYLSDFKFSGSIYSVPEGTPVFPNEPILTVCAPIIEAILIETFILLQINHQSLIATKAARIVSEAQGKPVYELGARRAHGADSAVFGARSAFIGGCQATSNTLAGKLFNIPVCGTMAHSWVQMFDSEYEAFKSFCLANPKKTVLLVDTYDTLSSGLPNAIRAFKEIFPSPETADISIRIDSGDLEALSKLARNTLDNAGLYNCKIIASSSLDEFKIKKLINNKAPIDGFGVGEALITSKTSPVFGGVYKMCAIEDDNGNIIPRIKTGDNMSKSTIPHFKKLFRVFDMQNKTAVKDVVTIYNESPNDLVNITPLLLPIFEKGQLVYCSPYVKSIASYCKNQIELLPDEIKSISPVSSYLVEFSGELNRIKEKLIKQYK